MRYFMYTYAGSTYDFGRNTGNCYFFNDITPTPVSDDDDAEGFLRWGSPDRPGSYRYRETDSQGNQVGLFPPIDTTYPRVAIFKPPKTDGGLTAAESWALIEKMDPTIRAAKARKRLI